MTKKIHKAIGKQLNYLARNLKSIDALLTSGSTLTPRQKLWLETIRKVYGQQKSMYDKRNHSVTDRIVSLSQPWLRPIVRGKAGAAVADSVVIPKPPHHLTAKGLELLFPSSGS